MPIVKCFECGKSVSNTAKNCPHCGAFEPAVSVKEHNSRVKEEDDNVKMLWGVAGFILLAWVIFMIVILAND
jgi:hypothetical protein